MHRDHRSRQIPSVRFRNLKIQYQYFCMSGQIILDTNPVRVIEVLNASKYLQK